MLADEGDALGGSGGSAMLYLEDLSISYTQYFCQGLLCLSGFFSLLQNPLAEKFF